jgi:hypothetical protein
MNIGTLGLEAMADLRVLAARGPSPRMAEADPASYE